MMNERETSGTPPSSMVCCITGEVMMEPWSDPEGNTYERSAIEKWLTMKAESPVTRTPLRLDQLIPNRALKELIEKGGWRRIITSSPQDTKRAVPEHRLIDTTTTLYTVDRTGREPSSLIKVESRGEINPKHIVLLIDTSGSMGTECTNSDPSNTERDGLTLMCIVKHAVSTVIAMMRPQDYVTIVTFSTTANVVGKFVSVGDVAQVRKLQADLASMRPRGSTNMWDGLQKSLDIVVETVDKLPFVHTNIMLLTDGIPNPEPPRGTPLMFTRWCDQFPHAVDRMTVGTFGFGYSMDSKLLRDLANIGNGTYAFTPDSTFTGTIFIHAAASVLSTLDDRALGGNLPGGVLADQPRSALCTLQRDGAELRDGLGVTIKCDVHRHVRIEDPAEIRLPALKLMIETEAEREVASCLENLLNYDTCNMSSMLITLQDTIKSLNRLKDEVRAEGDTGENISNMITDLSGQVKSATSRRDWWERWGRHYVGSLLSAYNVQTCNNFKDPGIQNERFCGERMMDMRDRGETIFLSLPPPRPAQARSRGDGASTTTRSVVDVARYMDRNGGCFSGDSEIELADGSTCSIKRLRMGHMVYAEDRHGVAIPNGAEVRCILKMCDIPVDLVDLRPGLKLTPTHPVKHHQRWTHPHQIKESTCTTNVVFNVVLDDGSASVRVGGVQCVTLGHMIPDDQVASHPYLGTNRIKEDLARCKGWTQGYITMSGPWLLRDVDGFCCGIRLNAEENTVLFDS